MKTLQLVSLCTILTLAGCTHTPPDQKQIAAAAVVIRGAARSGAIVATTPPDGDPANKQYFQLASQGIGLFLTGTDYSPALFQEALLKVDGPQLQNPYVRIAIGSAVDLYQLYILDYVTGAVGTNSTARQFLVAVQDGFQEALQVGTTTLRANRPPVIVLPRPIVMRK